VIPVSHPISFSVVLFLPLFSPISFAIWCLGSYYSYPSEQLCRRRSSRHCTLRRIGQTRRWYVYPQLCFHLRFTRFLTQPPPHLPKFCPCLVSCSTPLSLSSPATRTHSFWVRVPSASPPIVASDRLLFFGTHSIRPPLPQPYLFDVHADAVWGDVPRFLRERCPCRLPPEPLDFMCIHLSPVIRGLWGSKSVVNGCAEGRLLPPDG